MQPIRVTDALSLSRTGAGRRGKTVVMKNSTRTRAPRLISLVSLCAIVALSACAGGFQVRKYPTNPALFQAGLKELNRKKYDNAVTAFERLTLDLSARDSLLPPSHYYLGKAHEGRGEYLLAAQSYARLAETFPDDSLAPLGLLAGGNAYLKLWRSPALDPTYGTMAQTQYRLLSSLYPDSKYREEADRGALSIDEMMATKDYETAQHYVRRKAFDSAIIYFKDVVRNYPNTQISRDAMMRMVEVYRRPEMNYKDEAKEMCTALLGAYPNDGEVSGLCPADGSAPLVAPKKGKTAPAPSRKPATATPVPAAPAPATKPPV
jgi:outer membrane protein assembly factor BamD